MLLMLIGKLMAQVPQGVKLRQEEGLAGALCQQLICEQKKNEEEAGIEPTWGDPVGLAGRRLDRPPPPPPRNLPRGAGVTPTQGGTVRRGYANLVSLRVEQMIASDDPFAGGVLHGAHRGPQPLSLA